MELNCYTVSKIPELSCCTDPTEVSVVGCTIIPYTILKVQPKLANNLDSTDLAELYGYTAATITDSIQICSTTCYDQYGHPLGTCNVSDPSIIGSSITSCDTRYKYEGGDNVLVWAYNYVLSGVEDDPSIPYTCLARYSDVSGKTFSYTYFSGYTTAVDRGWITDNPCVSLDGTILAGGTLPPSLSGLAYISNPNINFTTKQHSGWVIKGGSGGGGSSSSGSSSSSSSSSSTGCPYKYTISTYTRVVNPFTCAVKFLGEVNGSDGVGYGLFDTDEVREKCESTPTIAEHVIGHLDGKYAIETTLNKAGIYYQDPSGESISLASSLMAVTGLQAPGSGFGLITPRYDVSKAWGLPKDRSADDRDTDHYLPYVYRGISGSTITSATGSSAIGILGGNTYTLQLVTDVLDGKTFSFYKHVGGTIPLGVVNKHYITYVGGSYSVTGFAKDTYYGAIWKWNNTRTLTTHYTEWGDPPICQAVNTRLDSYVTLNGFTSFTAEVAGATSSTSSTTYIPSAAVFYQGPDGSTGSQSACSPTDSVLNHSDCVQGYPTTENPYYSISCSNHQDHSIGSISTTDIKLIPIDEYYYTLNRADSVTGAQQLAFCDSTIAGVLYLVCNAGTVSKAASVPVSGITHLYTINADDTVTDLGAVSVTTVPAYRYNELTEVAKNCYFIVDQ